MFQSFQALYRQMPVLIQIRLSHILTFAQLIEDSDVSYTSRELIINLLTILLGLALYFEQLRNWSWIMSWIVVVCWSQQLKAYAFQLLLWLGLPHGFLLPCTVLLGAGTLYVIRPVFSLMLERIVRSAANSYVQIHIGKPFHGAVEDLLQVRVSYKGVEEPVFRPSFRRWVSQFLVR